jgi:hypothetical protein
MRMALKWMNVMYSIGDYQNGDVIKVLQAKIIQKLSNRAIVLN